MPVFAYPAPLRYRFSGLLTMRDLALTHAIHRTLYERQKPVPLVYRDLKLDCGYRPGSLVGKRIVVEIKSIEAIAPLRETVMLAYLRLSEIPLGLLIHFNMPFFKGGIRRYVWPDKEKDNPEARRET